MFKALTTKIEIQKAQKKLKRKLKHLNEKRKLKIGVRGEEHRSTSTLSSGTPLAY